MPQKLIRHVMPLYNDAKSSVVVAEEPSAQLKLRYEYTRALLQAHC